MIYKQIPEINQPLSAFVYGTNAKMTGEDTPAAVDILDAAYEAGFRCFDTANSYGHSEENIGKWLSLRGTREHIVLLDNDLAIDTVIARGQLMMKDKQLRVRGTYE